VLLLFSKKLPSLSSKPTPFANLFFIVQNQTKVLHFDTTMGEKDDGLGLRLSLKWGENDDDDNNMNQQHPFNMHKPPQSVPNQRPSSFNDLFPFHGKVINHNLSILSIHFFIFFP